MEDHTTSTLQDLAHIRQLMDRSTRFLSLSGWSGIATGLTGLAGGSWAYLMMAPALEKAVNGGVTRAEVKEVFLMLALDAALLLATALALGWYFTWRAARRDGHSLLTAAGKRMLVSLFIPLVAGGLACVIITLQGYVLLLPGLTLIFFGLSMVAAATHTRTDIYYLGLLELPLGIVALTMRLPDSLLVWTAGFGLLPLVYGIIMQVRYRK